MRRNILIACMTVLLILGCGIHASAEEFDPLRIGSISVTLTEQYEDTPIVGAELSVYYIATVGINTDGNLNYIYTEAFAELGISIDDPELTAKLDAYLSQAEAEAMVQCTDAEGNAVYSDLPLGLYFVRQTNTVEGFATCAPFLVTVPMANEDGYVYAVNASPKTEVSKLVDITLEKVWNTDASAHATDSVTVELLCNDQVVQTAILSEVNNWQVTYTNMPASNGYSIREVDIPQGFTATYTQRGYVFTVINTSTLVQTGQLTWPIPVLAISGVLLIGVGIVLMQKKRKANA